MASFESLFQQTRIVPVVTIEDLDTAVPIAQALVKGGIDTIEITLRSQVGLEAIRAVHDNVTNCRVCAGTITESDQLAEVKKAGAAFAVSPGITLTLLDTAASLDIPFMPGVCTPSEILAAKELGCRYLKFFPANLSGGIAALKNFSVLFPDMQFLPTGGINTNNLEDYLAMPNVFCTGGSWLTPKDLVANKQWDKITELAKQATSIS